MVASILVSIAGPSIKFAMLFYMNTYLCGQKCNYTVINQSDSFHRNSVDFKFVCMQVYQTLLLRERGSGSETSGAPNKPSGAHCSKKASKNRKGGSGKSAGVEVYTVPGMQAHF